MSRRVLVTGAASGIGHAVAARALREGAQIACADLDADRLLAMWPEPGVAVPMDVRSAHSVAEGLELITSRWGGPPDAVVHAAGVYRIRASLDLDPAEWSDVLAVNLTGAMLVGQASARAMAAAGRPGALVLVSSIAAERGDRVEPAAHYAASKGGVSALCRQLAVEWGHLDIRVNAVAPGVIDTPMLRLGDDPDRMRSYLDHQVPLARLGSADEVAAACWFLVSDESSYITGAVIPVDGGAGAA